MMVKSFLASALLGTATAMVTGQDIPPLGLDTAGIDFYKATSTVRQALDLGYVNFVAAPSYSNEPTVGEGICEADREAFWVTSKLPNDRHKGREVLMGVENSMGNLLTIYIDLYLVEWPVAFKRGTQELDRETTLIETWKEMEILVRASRTRHIGVANFAPADLEAILSVCTICPYAHEFELHPYLQQQEWVDWHLERGIKVIASSPLGDNSVLEDPFWKALAEKKNATVAQTVIAWGIQRGTTVAPEISKGATTLEENLGALDIHFTEEEMQEIAKQDRKTRFNNPGYEWGVELFKGLDDPTIL
ncbi:aldo/keto reductase [Stachybotrys elegans]|uniref:Aldo/keto reductase n=1 Tax=Stachybotrys elegans TaxID=80388 RepID=A0A8K0SCQ7_9HYPO|nr:aldo/keto reductase [Stachybotrys elegans]